MFTANEIANYVVCPEAWRLKRLHEIKPQGDDHHESTVREEKQAWTEQFQLVRLLRRYGKVAYLLLVSLALVVFLIDHRRTIVGFFGETEGTERLSRLPSLFRSMGESQGSIPFEIVMLCLLLALLIFFWDLFDRKSMKLAKEGGLSSKSEVITLKGIAAKESGELVSQELQLSGTPDALVREQDELIPVIVKPSSKKVFDRHIIELIVYMKLLSKREKRRCSHGKIILGREKREINIDYTPERERWLDTLIDEMNAIADGVPPLPTPSKFKCRHCDVEAYCSHSLAE